MKIGIRGATWLFETFTPFHVCKWKITMNETPKLWPSTAPRFVYLQWCVVWQLSLACKWYQINPCSMCHLNQWLPSPPTPAYIVINVCLTAVEIFNVLSLAKISLKILKKMAQSEGLVFWAKYIILFQLDVYCYSGQLRVWIMLLLRL